MRSEETFLPAPAYSCVRRLSCNQVGAPPDTLCTNAVHSEQILFLHHERVFQVIGPGCVRLSPGWLWCDGICPACPVQLAHWFRRGGDAPPPALRVRTVLRRRRLRSVRAQWDQPMRIVSAYPGTQTTF